MIVHSAAICFFTSVVKNYNSDLNINMFIERIVHYHITNIVTPVYLLSIFGSLASETIIKLHWTVPQLLSCLIIFTCFHRAETVCSVIWNAYCGLPNTSLKPGETLLEVMGTLNPLPGTDLPIQALPKALQWMSLPQQRM